MKLAQQAIISFILCGALFADEWKTGMPPEVSDLLSKLIEWENETRTNTEKSISEKRQLVQDRLEIELRKQRAGTPEARSIEHALDELKDTALDEEIVLTRSSRVGAGQDISAEDLLESIAPRLRVCSRGIHQGEKDTPLVEVHIDGAPIYKSGWNSGLQLIEVTKDGASLIYLAPESGDKEYKDYAQALEAHIEDAPAGSVLILAVHRNADQYSNQIRGITRMIGGKQKTLGRGQSYLCIGYRDLRPGGAIEVVGGSDKGSHAVFDGAKREEK